MARGGSLELGTPTCSGGGIGGPGAGEPTLSARKKSIQFASAMLAGQPRDEPRHDPRRGKRQGGKQLASGSSTRVRHRQIIYTHRRTNQQGQRGGSESGTRYPTGQSPRLPSTQ